MRGPDQAPFPPHQAKSALPADILTLELALPPDRQDQLLRSATFRALGAGKPRRSPLRLTWYDTSDGALAEKGRVLEVTPARRGARQRLLQVLPPDCVTWIPGTILPPLADAALPTAAPSALLAGLDEDQQLVGLAAAEGRRRSVDLSFEGVPARLELLDGRLRAVAAEQDFARLLMVAPAQTCLGIARLLAEEHALLPALPMAEAARALAVGRAPRPPRRGAPALDAGMSVENGFVHILFHLAGVLVWLLPAVAAGDGVDPVHQMRVALRRMRSAFSVWRNLISCEAARSVDDRLRDLARLLGPVRDHDVFLAGILAALEAALADDGAPTTSGLSQLRAALTRQRQEAHGRLAAWLGSPELPRLLMALLGLGAIRPWRDGAKLEQLAALEAPLPGFAASVLRRRSRKLLRGHEDLTGVPVPVLHALRLRGKRLRYAAEFFAPLYPGKRTRRYLRRLAALQEALGTLNDGATASSLVRALPPTRGAAGRAWAQGAVEGFVAAQAAAARAGAEQAWQALAEADPFWDD